MEVAISAISGEILSRFISFLIKKYTDQVCLEDHLERLQHLLLRVHTVVEEAEGRYITNSRMLVKLEMLVDAVYQGYHVLDTFRYKPLEEIPLQQQVRYSCAISSKDRSKRIGAVSNTMRINTSVDHELQAALRNLESVVENMTEFVIFLDGCNQMPKRPYDTYLYTDNFMFSRLAEKQHIINALLEDNSPHGSLVVLPIIGGYRVGKKSLFGYACNDNMVRSYFSSVLHLNSDNFWKVNHESSKPGRTLVLVEFISDVDDNEWFKFYSVAAHMSTGSKVVIISRFQEIARFGTVKPICLRSLSQAEFLYLFKVLAFGSTDPENHPQLASVGMKIALMLKGLLVVGNMLADLIRKNQNVQFWFDMFKRLRNSIERNFSNFGEHPKQLLERDHQTDITMLISPSSSPLHVMPSHDESNYGRKELSKMKFGDLIEGSTTIPEKEEFQMIIWESTIPPFTKFVTSCIQDKHPCTPSFNKRRRKLY